MDLEKLKAGLDRIEHKRRYLAWLRTPEGRRASAEQALLGRSSADMPEDWQPPEPPPVGPVLGPCQWSPGPPIPATVQWELLRGHPLAYW